MKKFLITIFVLAVLVLLGIVAQVYEYETCRDRVERLKLTGTEAEKEYERCKSF